MTSQRVPPSYFVLHLYIKQQNHNTERVNTEKEEEEEEEERWLHALTCRGFPTSLVCLTLSFFLSPILFVSLWQRFNLFDPPGM